MMKSSVIVFPGSNCDRDIAVALKKLQFKNSMIWHKETELPKSDLIVIPGGFSYGDYLRSGAIAAKSKGDNLGRKMIFPGSGATEGDYDYVYSLYARTVAELGAAADNYWMNINGSDEDKALGELIDSCSNSRIYITHQLK